MPGLADLLYLGQPDPSRQLAAMLSGQQPLGAAPPAAAPPTATGAAAADPNAQPANPVAPGATPPPNSPPVPTSLQSTPDMQSSYQALANPPNIMSLYIQMQQRQSASDQINRGLALIAANHSPPSMRESIMQSMTGGGTDAGQMVGNLMSLHSAMQQQAATQDMLKNADAYDAKLGYPPGTARDMILAGRGSELISEMKPTDMARNYAWAHDTYAKAHPGATPDEIDEGAQSILLGMGGMGGGDADTKSWRAAKIQWDQNPATKGTPYPWGTGADDNPTRFRAWSGSQVEADKSLASDQAEASKLGPQYRSNLEGARGRVAGILGIQADGSIDPAREAQLKNLLGTDMAQKFVNADPTKQGTWDQDLATWWGGLSADDRTLLTQIRDATDEKTLLGGLKTRAPKRGQSDASDIGVGLSGMRNVTQGYDDWVTGAKNTLKAIDTATMNSFGAQGTPEQAEDYARKHGLPNEAPTLMDDNYVSGGSMYPKGKLTGAMTQPQFDAATAAIKGASDPEAERQKQIKLALIRNTDPKPLKDLRL